jgi:hypothetical protein
MMLRTTPLLEIPHHSRSRSVVHRQVIASDTIDLTPAFAASGFQRELDVRESLIDLRVEIFRDPGGGDGQIGRGVPTTWKYRLGLAPRLWH